MKYINLTLLLLLFIACAKKENTGDTGNKTEKPVEEKLDFFAENDSSAWYKKYPMLRESTTDTPFDSLSLQQKFQMLESRAFFKDRKYEPGAFGDKYYAFLRDTSRNTFEKDLVCTHIKFKPGTAELVGLDTKELNDIIMASYSSLNLYFRVNVNATDAALRQARLESVKNAFTQARVNLAKIIFDDSLSGKTSSDELVLHLFQHKPGDSVKKK